ncbi:MAG: prepilin-type N-terminal cleavage/methylation domain-containing protein [Deltaproteobacteria bacterium]|nr:prepilin-type N-terminal cleavage/methylation domain-containing protein [Deltaproteobacteria bacterium]
MKGFTLIEVLVALVLFALGAAALAETLVVAQRQRVSSGRWLRAVELAEERLELVRAGERGTDGAPLGEFTRSWHAAAVAAGLERVDVTVTWEDRGPQSFALSALRRR